MRAVLTAAVAAVGFCGLAGAQDAAADPVGTWKCAYTIGDQKRTSTLSIVKDGDQLAGTMTWPDQKATKLTNVKSKADSLTFSAVREFMGNKIAIDYTLLVAGDTFKGKGKSDYGNKTSEFDIEGAREKKAK